MASGNLSRATALMQCSQILQGIDPTVVPITPEKLQGISAYPLVFF